MDHEFPIPVRTEGFLDLFSKVINFTGAFSNLTFFLIEYMNRELTRFNAFFFCFSWLSGNGDRMSFAL